MNRRKFFKWLGVGTAAVVVAPSAVAVCEDPWCGGIAGEGVIHHDELHDYDFSEVAPVIQNYVDYSNFSEFVLASSIDESVANAAAELDRSYGKELNRLIASNGCYYPRAFGRMS